jgi:hypothetical protein
MGEQRPAERPADDQHDPSDDVPVDELIERIRRWLFEGGPDPSPP